MILFVSFTVNYLQISKSFLYYSKTWSCSIYAVCNFLLTVNCSSNQNRNIMDVNITKMSYFELLRQYKKNLKVGGYK